MEWHWLVKAIKEVGQFPAGVLVGILIHRWATKKLLEHVERTQEIIKEEREAWGQLITTISRQESKKEP